MSELAKTATFVLVAVAALSAAAYFNSTAKAPDAKELVGTVLNKDIDVTAPRRLQIAKFDRQTASVRQFEVAEVDGVWCIPSKDNYPADATEQMADAATCLTDRKVLRVAGDSPSSHEEFGVVDPLAPKLNSKSVGVGTHVTMTDADGEKLVDMIIGSQVKDNPAQHYVRQAKQDVVYVVELDPSKLTTDFADWIEKDLLKLKEMDLREIFINDYSADLSLGMRPDGRPAFIVDTTRRDEMTFRRDEESAPWTVAKLLKFDPATNGMAPSGLAEGEELNQDAIKALVTGLNELTIVDVARKPAGLSADLKAGDAFMNDAEAAADLMKKGFLPVRSASGSELLSSEGEVVGTLRNGVEYVLRFGQLQTHDETAAGHDEAAGDAAGADAPSAKPDDGANLRRYLFVMAKFNEDAVEKPKYQPLPELPAEEPATSGEGENADAAAAAKPAEGEADAADDAESGAAEAAADESADQDKDSADKDSAEKDAAAKKRAEIEAERARIEEENAHIREEYEALISAGQEEAKDLNARFGDWYFVISNDVYKKIHVDRAQVVTKKEPPAAEGEGAAAPDATSGLPDLGGATIPAPPAVEP
jgi:hypothetical protein